MKDEWKTIESAPQDGKEFLAIYARQGNVMELVRFNKIYQRWESKGKPILGFIANATHWTQLPDPPKE